MFEIILVFQSPRSGQICSNSGMASTEKLLGSRFQSPRSGQICSNEIWKGCLEAAEKPFQSPRSGQICSNFKLNQMKGVTMAVSIP